MNEWCCGESTEYRLYDICGQFGFTVTRATERERKTKQKKANALRYVFLRIWPMRVVYEETNDKKLYFRYKPKTHEAHKYILSQYEHMSFS